MTIFSKKSKKKPKTKTKNKNPNASQKPRKDPLDVRFARLAHGIPDSIPIYGEFYIFIISAVISVYKAISLGDGLSNMLDDNYGFWLILSTELAATILAGQIPAFFYRIKRNLDLDEQAGIDTKLPDGYLFSWTKTTTPKPTTAVPKPKPIKEKKQYINIKKYLYFIGRYATPLGCGFLAIFCYTIIAYLDYTVWVADKMVMIQDKDYLLYLIRESDRYSRIAALKFNMSVDEFRKLTTQEVLRLSEQALAFKNEKKLFQLISEIEERKYWVRFTTQVLGSVLNFGMDLILARITLSTKRIKYKIIRTYDMELAQMKEQEEESRAKIGTSTKKPTSKTKPAPKKRTGKPKSTSTAKKGPRGPLGK